MINVLLLLGLRVCVIKPVRSYPKSRRSRQCLQPMQKYSKLVFRTNLHKQNSIKRIQKAFDSILVVFWEWYYVRSIMKPCTSNKESIQCFFLTRLASLCKFEATSKKSSHPPTLSNNVLHLLWQDQNLQTWPAIPTQQKLSMNTWFICKENPLPENNYQTVSKPNPHHI